ncbi:Glycine zipper [Roseomonas rosea]|uniref:Glycine zipper n=1 Tax=Muricoccus roseus TaxID=198092 RepID=A0A1M6MUZ2_9PROT|nr:glycine zipper domain-containing protein [Roseomonas rosea]SHJ87267.1 Glycine zipper [Roseomonas rosea]
MTLRAARLALPLLATLSLGACADATRTERNVGTGALGGAALGGIIGSFSGNAGWGALIGGAGGAGAGYLYEQSQRAQDRAYWQGRQDSRRYRR